MKTDKKVKFSEKRQIEKNAKSPVLSSDSDVYASLDKTCLSDPLNSRRCLLPLGMPSWTLEYTLSGREYVRSPSGQTAYFGHGDMLLTKPGLPRDQGQASDCKEWTRFWFVFNPHPHWEATLLDWPELSPGTMHIAIPVELRTQLEPRMRQAVEIYRSSWEYRDEMVMNIIEEMLLWCHTVNPKTSFAGLDEKNRKALHYISRHFAEPLQVEDVAQHVGLSRTRFTVFFRQQTGQTPRAYIESCRLEEAINLLKLKHLTVAEVANACGFSHPPHFSTIFKARTGKSPSELQKGK